VCGGKSSRSSLSFILVMTFVILLLYSASTPQSQNFDLPRLSQSLSHIILPNRTLNPRPPTSVFKSHLWCTRFHAAHVSAFARESPTNNLCNLNVVELGLTVAVSSSSRAHELMPISARSHGSIAVSKLVNQESRSQIKSIRVDETY